MVMQAESIDPATYPTQVEAARTLVLSYFRRALEKALAESAKGDVTLKGAFKKHYYRQVFMDATALDLLRGLLPDDLLPGKMPGRYILTEPQRFQYLEFGIRWALDESPAAELLKELGLTIVVYDEYGVGVRASIAELAKQ